MRSGDKQCDVGRSMSYIKISRINYKQIIKQKEVNKIKIIDKDKKVDKHLGILNVWCDGPKQIHFLSTEVSVHSLSLWYHNLCYLF